MIKSFSDPIAEKIFNREKLTRREIRSVGALNLDKAFDRINFLSQATERDLLALVVFHYHSLHTGRYSIDAESRRSPWRITFEWDNAELSDVKLVKIEDTH